MRQQRYWSLPFALIAMLTFREAYGCSCSSAPDVGEALAQTDAVFLAKVSSISPISHTEDAEGRFFTEVAAFTVLRSWKGNLEPGDTVTVRSSFTSCGMNLSSDPAWLEEVDSETSKVPAEMSGIWLIYANGDQPYELSQCTRSRPVAADTDPEIEVLDEAKRAQQRGA